MRPSLARTPAGDVAVRDARPADAEAIATLHVESIRTLCRDHYEPEQIEAWASGIDGNLHRAAIRTSVVMVAVRQRVVIGFGEYDPGRGQLVHLFVDPSVAGCRVGTRLADALEARALSDGVTEMRLRASTNAEPFYAARGWVQAGGPRELVIRGTSIACVPMRKNLTAARDGEPGTRAS